MWGVVWVIKAFLCAGVEPLCLTGCVHASPLRHTVKMDRFGFGIWQPHSARVFFFLPKASDWCHVFGSGELVQLICSPHVTCLGSTYRYQTLPASDVQLGYLTTGSARLNVTVFFLGHANIYWTWLCFCDVYLSVYCNHYVGRVSCTVVFVENITPLLCKCVLWDFIVYSAGVWWRTG